MIHNDTNMYFLNVFLLALQTNLMKRAWHTLPRLSKLWPRSDALKCKEVLLWRPWFQQADMLQHWSPGEQEQESVYKTICSNLHYRGQDTYSNVLWLWSLFVYVSWRQPVSSELARFSNAPLRMHRICVLGPCASGRKKIAGVVWMCSTFASRASVRSYRNHIDFTIWTSMCSRWNSLSETQATSRFCWITALGKDHTVQHASQKAWSSSRGWSLRDNGLFTFHYVCTEAWSYAESVQVWHWNCSWHRFGMKTVTCAWGFGNIAARQAGGTSGSFWTHDTLFMVDSTCNAGRRKRRSATWIRGWWRSLCADRIVFISILQPTTCESLCKT